MQTCAGFVAELKQALGDKRMSDRELGEDHLGGYAQQTIAKAKKGQMSDGVALAVGERLVKLGVIEHVGEVILVAHAERDADPKVRRALMDFAKKVVGRASQATAAALAGVAVVIGLMGPAHDARMVTGGEGGIRTHGTLRYA